jgi:hypothetical protein
MGTCYNDELIGVVLMQLAAGQLDPCVGRCLGKDKKAMRSALKGWFTSAQRSSRTKGGNSTQYQLICQTDMPGKAPQGENAVAKCGVCIKVNKRDDKSWYITYADIVHKNMCLTVAQPTVQAVASKLGAVILPQKDISSRTIETLIRGSFGSVTMSRRSCLRVKHAVQRSTEKDFNDTFSTLEPLIEQMQQQDPHIIIRCVSYALRACMQHYSRMH